MKARGGTNNPTSSLQVQQPALAPWPGVWSPDRPKEGDETDNLLEDQVMWQDYLSEAGEFYLEQGDAAEEYAVDSYTQEGHMLINASMRAFAEHKDPSGLREEAKNLHNLVQRSRLPQPVKVYRGIPFSTKELAKTPLDPRKLSVGDTIQDASFMSTSADKDIAAGFAAEGVTLGNHLGQQNYWPVLLEMEVPTDAPAIYVEGIKDRILEDMMEESEVIVGAGTQWRVKAIQDFDLDNTDRFAKCAVITLEYVGQDHPLND